MMEQVLAAQKALVVMQFTEHSGSLQSEAAAYLDTLVTEGLHQQAPSAYLRCNESDQVHTYLHCTLHTQACRMADVSANIKAIPQSGHGHTPDALSDQPWRPHLLAE